MATVLPTETPQFAFADDAEFNGKLKAKQVPPGQRHRGREELRLRLLARAGLLLPQGLRAHDRGPRLRPHLPPERHQPRPQRRDRARHRGVARATSSRSTADKVVNKTTGQDASRWCRCPKARQAIIDAGGLIAYTRKRVMEAAGKA